MNKKAIMVGVILLAICVSITMVGAETYNYETSFENNVLTINDVKFTIPDGYQENESAEILGEDNGQAELKGNRVCSYTFYQGDDLIIITVSDNKTALTLDDIAPLYKNSEKKNIGGHEGVLSQVNGGVLFGYIQDGKAVDILAPDENTLTTIVK